MQGPDVRHTSPRFIVDADHATVDNKLAVLSVVPKHHRARLASLRPTTFGINRLPLLRFQVKRKELLERFVFVVETAKDVEVAWVALFAGRDVGHGGAETVVRVVARRRRIDFFAGCRVDGAVL